MKIKNTLQSYAAFCSFFGLKPGKNSSLKEFKKFLENMKK
jgi:hypothetical protein